MKKMLEMVRRGFEVEYNGYKLSYNKLSGCYVAQGNGKLIQRRNESVFAGLIAD